MATTAGVLEILIKTRDETSSGLSAAESKVKSFTGSMSSWAVAKGQLISNFVQKAGTAVINLGKDATKTSMAFDKAMSQYIATRGATLEDLRNETSEYAKEMQQMTKFAQEMGLKGKYSATEVAEALNYMALAGYNAETSMEMMPKVLALAAAGDMDLARASDIVTDAQTAFGLSVEETGVMVDQMAKTASVTNTSVEQLGEAFLTVGANARSIIHNGDTTELNAILGQLASNGIKGAKGGTVLRNILNALSNPAGKAAKQLKEIGVNAYDDQHNLRNMTDILADMSQALSGKTMEEQAEFFSKAFNVRDTAAVKALLDVSKDGWTDLMLQIFASKNAAQDMAEVQLDNLDGDISKLKNSLEDAKLEIMKGITPQLRNLVQKGTTWIKRLTAAFGKGGLKGEVEEAKNILNETITELKSSDSPILQKLGGALEKIKEFGKGAYDLVTDFHGTIAKWKESDSAGLNAIATVLEAAGQAANVLVAAFNGGLPAAIDKLHEIGTPISETAAAGLEVFKSVCETVAGNSGIGGIITTIAEGFLLLKGVEISGSLLLFISKLSSIKNASGLSKLIKELQGGSAGGSGDTTTSTTGKPSWVTGFANFAKLGLTTATMLAPAIISAVVAKLIPDEMKLGNEARVLSGEYSKEEIKNVRDYVDLLNKRVELEQKFGTSEWNEAEYNKLNDQIDALSKLATASELFDKFSDYLRNRKEGELTPGSDIVPIDLLNQMLGEGLESEVNFEPNFSAVEGAEPPTLQGTVEYTPAFSDGGGVIETPFGKTYHRRKPKAKGDWNVPYDNYPALLHRGELVLTSSQARRYRDGETGGSSEIVGAIQSLKTEMSNMKIMVGQKVFGRTVVDYGGRRISNYIGNADSKLAAGYGT